ncbi:LANO_0D01332g1_1 [Lachancea nothofagi CBS 11611]|uniref:LANO_0D01332g1_1 n=1 Tax=Lachancea nothofagi CBS 11611 TaxID=1266666 RepID=A0A1G4JDP2_9SACH|nr:LANO_0D01332g1_1 [Lachancea nothofagi CBS 11611]
MGVPAFWDIIKGHSSIRRIPFKQFVIDHRTTHGKSPRLAIDAFAWLFECGFILGENENLNEKGYKTDALAIVTLLKRINLLLSLDVTFILVFDGPMKPDFKNRSKLKTRIATEEEDAPIKEGFLTSCNQHLKQHESGVPCSSATYEAEGQDGVSVAKRLLSALNISWIDACGEGEAECARLQVRHLVDYVVSNDSDAFVFGANKVLRNMSKFWEDLPASYGSPMKKKDHKEIFVTVVDIGKITGWNQDQIVLYYVLLGADYSQGVRGLGSKKSAILAQLKEPDLALQLMTIFSKQTSCPEIIRERYLKFQRQVFEICQSQSKVLFGRRYFSSSGVEAFQGWPSELAIMHYLYPVLSPEVNTQKLIGNYANVSGSLKVDAHNFRDLFQLLRDFELKRITNLRSWFHEMSHTTFMLKELLYNVRTHEEQTKSMKITDEWSANVCHDKFRIEYWRVRYNSFLTGVEEPKAVEESESSGDGIDVLIKGGHDKVTSLTRKQLERTAHKYMTSIPKALVPDSHILVMNYRLEKRKVWERSPSKKQKSSRKSSPQKNTLDDFLKSHASPKKNEEAVSISTDVLPTRRKLFVDDVSDCGESTFSQLADSSSLILVSEKDCESSGLHASPKRNLDVLFDHQDVDSDTEAAKSPMKRRTISGIHETTSLRAPRLLPDNYVDLTIDNET